MKKRRPHPQPALPGNAPDPILGAFTVPVLVTGPELSVRRLNAGCATLLGPVGGSLLNDVFPGLSGDFTRANAMLAGTGPRRQFQLETLVRLPAGEGGDVYIGVHEMPAPAPEREPGYRAFLERSSAAIFRFSFDHPVDTSLAEGEQVEAILRYARLAEASESLARVRGVSSDALKGGRLEDFAAHPEVQTRECLRRFVRGGYTLQGVEMRESTPDGERLFTAEWIGVVENGQLVGIWGSQQDVTAHRNAEEELRATGQRYRKLFDTASGFLFTVDSDGRLTSVNAALERLAGLTEGNLPQLEAIVAPEHRPPLAQLLSRALREGRGGSTEVDVVGAGGRRLSLELTLSPLYGGDAGSLLGVARNITGQRTGERFDTGRRAILEMVATDIPLDVVLDRLTGVVEMYFPHSLAALSRAENGRLRYIAGRLPEAFRAAFAGTRIAPMSLSCGTAAFLQRPVVASSIETDPTWSELRTEALAHGLRACWSTPITGTSGALMGTLAVYFPEPAEGDHELLSLLDAAAQLAALTIEHRAFTERLRHQATHDPLTGLPNRYALEARLREALVEAGPERRSFSLLYVDLDRFKMVNDTYGHGTGDAFLQQVGTRLSACMAEGDLLARIGGDEFVALLLHPAHRSDAGPVMVAIRKALQRPVTAQGRELFVSVSIGVSVYPEHGSTVEALLGNADAALAQAKNEGKNTHRYFAPRLAAETTARLAVQNELHRALDRGEFSVVYQPQFNLQNGMLVGKEALLRWKSGALGPVEPAEFIPIAEENGLIVPIGLWVLRQACLHGAAIRHKTAAPVRIAVNVSAVQLAQTDFVQQVAEALQDTGMPPELLELELTETALMHDHRQSAERLAQLRQLGVVISVDDFGTGYSSLSRLQQLPLDRLKIDLSFVREIRNAVEVPPIVQAIIALAHGLGIHVIAEGVENRHQLQVLRDLGCNEAQGFLLGRPAPAEDTEPAYPLSEYPVKWDTSRAD
jgi:diguanylate cyclase (GGDEF)-like protein/PAS domain S-box-containing protein